VLSRRRPTAIPARCWQAWRRGEVQAVSALSGETLENFVALLGPRARSAARSAALVVPHAAIARIATRGASRACWWRPPAPRARAALSPLRVTP
jgi:uroporphyrinogen-III synthase